MSRLGSRRRLLSLAIALVAAVSVVGGALYARSASADVSPYNAHPITVHPQYQRTSQLSAPNGQVVFTCQVPGAFPIPCYGPDQIRAAYDIQPLLNAGTDGTGRTIVIIDAYQSPTIQQDLQLFDSVWGLPAPPAFNIIPGQGSLTPFNPADGNQVGWSAEISLDVQWAHAVAPGAKIDLVLSKTNNDSDILAATQYAVDNNLGDVISQSFGEGESCADPNLLRAEHVVFQEATAKGMTIFASSGDNGAGQPDCNNDGGLFLSASTPASDPLVTGVGGTNLTADLNTGAYGSESAWNDGFGESGGGFSSMYSRPPYQAPFDISHATRGVPDVAYNAGVYGGVVAAWGVPFGPGAFFIFGGTSAGSPQWAGITALADQQARQRLGFLNDALYHIGKNPAYSSDFHDITTGNNDVPGIGGYSTGPNWDPVTGFGTPDVAKLVSDLIAAHVSNDGSNL